MFNVSLFEGRMKVTAFLAHQYNGCPQLLRILYQTN